MPSFCGFKRVLVVNVRMDSEVGCRANRNAMEGSRHRRHSVESPRALSILGSETLLPARESSDVNLNNAMKLPWRAGELTTPVDTFPASMEESVPRPKFSTEPIDHSYNLSEKIGSGTYGTVYSACDNCTGQHVAVKEIGRSPSNSRRKVSNRARQEAKFLEALQDCSSVVGFRQFFEEEDGRESYIVMEYCEGGDLEEFVRDNGPVSEGQAGMVAWEVLNVLQACHEKRILHGDIKAANFAIRSDIQLQVFRHGPAQLLRPGWLKGIDFGTCQKLGYGGVSQRVGTPTHWAPEVFGGQYKTEADLWSAGVLIYQLMAGEHPFFTKEEERKMKSSTEILLAIVHREPDFSGEPWLDCSPQVIDFIKGLLVRDPQARMTASMALDHPWMEMYQNRRQGEKPFLGGKALEMDSFVPCFN